jgi:hypothetical protein
LAWGPSLQAAPLPPLALAGPHAGALDCYTLMPLVMAPSGVCKTSLGPLANGVLRVLDLPRPCCRAGGCLAAMQRRRQMDAVAARWGPEHCTALHCTALHCTVLHCTAQVLPEYGQYVGDDGEFSAFTTEWVTRCQRAQVRETMLYLVLLARQMDFTMMQETVWRCDARMMVLRSLRPQGWGPGWRGHDIR